VPIDDATIGARTVARSRTVGDERTSIVVYFEQNVQVVGLDEGVPVVLGRSAPADLVVPEPNLSRKHARFTALEGGVKVEDLGSTNGTHYKGERIKEVVLGTGDSVTLGRVTVSVSRAEGRANLLGDFLGWFDFIERLRDEVVRARTFRRGVAVFAIRAVSGEDNHVATWAAAVRKILRPVDRMALHGTNAAFALAPETDEDRARGVAQQIAEMDPRLAVGVALHQSSAEELIDQARSLVRRATPADRVSISTFDALAGASPPIFASKKMIELEELVERVARAKVPVLVTGETGAGKDIIAQAIHQRGPRSELPMLVVSCGAMPAQMVEDVLFGHVKGAFEGATDEHAGLFERANGGTLFLDEVGELNEAAQAALLRVLEAQKLRRLGAEDEISVDVRVIAATNRDLRAMVEERKFRSDLLFRLSPLTIVVPPLREREGDIDPMVDRFLTEASLASGAKVRGIKDDARAALRAYAWPGNVRELKNAIEQAVVTCTAEKVRLEDLPKELQPQIEEEAEGEATEEASAGDGGLRGRVRAYEQGLITDALARSDNDPARAAKLLGMPLRSLQSKMRAYKIA
jgi:two-component system response regulator AtoC